MKVTIIDKSRNELLKRTEISFKVEDVSVPPSRKDLRDKVAALENTKPEQTIIYKISHDFGSKEISGTARIYDSAEAMEKTELPYMVGRNKGVKKGKKQKEEKAEAAPEKPTEAKEEAGEKKEEAPAEKKEEAPEKKKEAPKEAKKEEKPVEDKKEGEQ